jgi:hypothetical protein
MASSDSYPGTWEGNAVRIPADAGKAHPRSDGEVLTMRRFLRAIPITRATAALWAWRNRREVGRWLGFAWHALPPSGSDREDLLAEARLRAGLAKDERTRGLPTLSVRVLDGTAFLDGRFAPAIHDLVVSITESTKGIRAIECRIGDRGTRGLVPPHVHATHVPARTDR